METLELDAVSLPAAVALKALFDEQGLGVPPLPASLRASLVQLAPGLFAAGAAASASARPFEVDEQLASLARSREDRMLVAFGGHGLNSQALYCFLVQAPLAVFVVRRWGNAFDDPEVAGRRIRAALDATRQLVESAARLAANGAVPAGQWLVVTDADQGVQRCGWSDLTPQSLGALGAPAGAPPLFSALLELRRCERTGT